MRALEHCSSAPRSAAHADPARLPLREPARAGEAVFPRWSWRPLAEPVRVGEAVFPRSIYWLATAPLRRPESRRNHQEKELCHARATVPESETCGCRRLSKTPPSVYACLPNSPALAPTSAPVSSSGGKNPGNAEEAATAIGTVASPLGMWSRRNLCPPCRRIMSKPSRLNEHRQPQVSV